MSLGAEITRPWPIEALRDRLSDGDILYQLTRSKQATRHHDVRESGLEDIVRDVMIGTFGNGSVLSRCRISETLGLWSAPFPGQTRPDIAIRFGGKTHFLELKSSRIDYPRFDKEFKSLAFKEFLASAGDAGRVPWEVEQDLIKLSLYTQLSREVGSCLFIMIDAYAGSGRSWTTAFESTLKFRDTMRTKLVQGWAHTIRAEVAIQTLEAGGASAHMIICPVHQWCS